MAETRNSRTNRTEDTSPEGEVEASLSAEDAARSLVVEDLRKTFDGGDIVAADDVSFTVDPDELVVLLGPSGCGKSTTLRCVAGLETVDEGNIYLGDENITRYKPKDRDLAFVFQSIALFSHLTVRENIRFGLDMNTDLGRTEKENRVVETAELLRIKDLLDRKPTVLSGGQRQRVSIGRAMVTEPSAFLLDEPFSDLDANLRSQMQTEVKELKQDVIRPMVFVTHDQDEAMTIGDKIIVMRDGRIQQAGSPYEIYNDPANQFISTFIGSPSTNLIDCTVERSGDSIALVTSHFEFSFRQEEEEELSDHVGETVKLAVRPEHIEVDPGDTATASLEVSAKLIQPKGSRDVVRVTGNGLELTVLVASSKVEKGDTFTVGIDRDDTWVFDGEGDRVI